jgi:hypothetical protein
LLFAVINGGKNRKKKARSQTETRTGTGNREEENTWGREKHRISNI